MLRLANTLVLFISMLVAATSAYALNSVSMQLLWQHQFEFAGYYAALHKGFYKDAGLDVTLKEGGPNISPVDEVLQGHAQFGVSNSSLVHAYQNGKPVLMLAPVFQHSPLVLLSLGKQLTNPAAVAKAGTISLQPGDEDLELKAIFVSEGISLDKLKIAEKSLGLKDLLDGKIVAMNAYLSNEPYFLQQQGISYSILKPENYGMDFYGGVLFTSQSMQKDNPEVVAAFRSATLKGWEYALAHQNEIIGLILSQYNTQGKSSELLAFEAKVLADMTSPELIQIGHSNPGRWQLIAKAYADKGIISKEHSLDGFMYAPEAPFDWRQLYPYLFAALAIILVLGGLSTYILNLNRMLRRSLEDVRHNQQIAEQLYAEQRQFMDMLNHELKTPLSVISMALGMEQVSPTAKRHAQQSVHEIDALVERCLQADQLEQHQLAPKRQSCRVEAMLAELQATSASPQRLRIQSQELPAVDTDYQLLLIVLGNLIDNALKYAEPGSPVHIGTGLSEHQGRRGILIGIANAPGPAGMPDPQRLFDKYYRSPNALGVTGSGLGLYLVHSMAKLLGGWIRYCPSENEVKFELWIPL